MQLDEQLQRELDAWRATGMTARFWWRDDDAVTDTPQLRRLLDIARHTGIVPAIAVVPEHADHALVALLSVTDCCVWQHGWGHYSYTAGEFGEGRAPDLMAHDALTGQRSLDRLFGPRGWQRVFVPPFHLLSIRFKELIPSLGYLGVSAGVQLTPPVDHVTEVNAEVDMMNWPERKMFSAAAICGMLVEQLVARRTGDAPAGRPIGLLTHHLVFGDNEWYFVLELLQHLGSHPSVEFLRADALFDTPTASSLESPPPRAVAAEFRAPAEITVVITSCGRQELLERTLDSFFKYNTYPIREFLVMEDGEAEKNRRLQGKYHPYNFRWLSTGKRIGQIAAIDAAYGSVDTEFIFHCEDDWEFTSPAFIEKSLDVLCSNPGILQVWLRALADTNSHPVMDYLLFAGNVPYRLLQPGHHTEEWGTWHGFSFNPGLRRRCDYTSIGSFGSFDPDRRKRSFEIEREVSDVYLKRGLLAAILADNGGHGYVRHIGWGCRVQELARDLHA
jgi:hypothetical protein